METKKTLKKNASVKQILFAISFPLGVLFATLAKAQVQRSSSGRPAQTQSQQIQNQPQLQPQPSGALDARQRELEQRLKDLAAVSPGLKEKAEFSVSGVSIQEFLRGLAEAHNLNINVDPAISARVTNNFRSERVANVLVFLARQYDLDFTFVGSIMSISQHHAAEPPRLIPPPHEIALTYNAALGRVTYDLSRDTVGQVAKKIMQLSGRNVVVAPGAAARLVTGFAQEVPLDRGVEKVAYLSDLKLTRGADGSYILEPLSEAEHLVSIGDEAQAASFAVRHTVGAGKDGALSIQVARGAAGHKTVKVSALAAPLSDIIRSAAEEAGISYFLYSDLKGTVSATVSGVSFDEFLTMIFKGTTYTYRTEKGIYMIGERGLEGLRTHRVVQLENRSLDSLQAYIPQEMRRGVEIKEFKELNSFLLTGSAPQIDEIVAFIKNIDRVVPMITIEVIIMDIRKSKVISTGISAGTADSVKSGGTIFPGLNYTFGSKSINSFLSTLGANNIINIGKVTPNFYVKLSALEQNSNVNIRQTPKLTTLNGHVANLSIGNTRYYTTTTQNVLGSLSTQTVVTQQFTPVEANLAIEIKPVVSGDEQVTLNIDVKISDFTDTPPLGPPPTSNSKFRSIIRVRNEEMVVLGGLERTERSDSGSGVPLLSRIPILKWLFSSRAKRNGKTVSVIFIKPTIQY